MKRAQGHGDRRDGLPRTYLRACLLLLVAEAPAHGYDLADQLAELWGAKVDPGAVYRALRAMEDHRLVASCWEESRAGPARRMYRLTPTGLDCLSASAGAVLATHRSLSAYLARHRQVTRSEVPARVRAAR